MTDTITGGASPGQTTSSGRNDSTDQPWWWRGSEESRRFSERLTASTAENPLAPFSPAILAVRWATTGVSIALASPLLIGVEPSIILWAIAVLAYTVARTFFPLRYTGTTRGLIILELEIGLNVLAVVATGYWNSPLVLVLINAIIVAGFARGYGFAIRVAVASTLAVTVPAYGLGVWTPEQWAEGARWTTLLVSSGIVAGYSRRLSGEANRRHTIALDRVARLADANTLLANLHRVAQTLPASLDQGDVLDSTITRLRTLVVHDSSMIVVLDEVTESWAVARRTGNGPSGDLPWARFPAAGRDAIEVQRLIRVDDLDERRPGFSPGSRSAIYAPLLARGRLIGLLAVESRSADAFTARDEQLLRGFVEPAALAIDNARWFDRIRTVGADEERTRIARDLHDRIGQSLAYLGFEVDRMIRHDDDGAPVGDQLRRLRDDIRSVVGEVRDTLSDLRTDVTDDIGFAETAELFAARLAERSKLRVSIDCDTGHRLPILQERELWRIAQEALVNVERHAQATEVVLRWRCDDHGALLEVIDNGTGLPEARPDGSRGRSDSYGLIGMGERADSIGATLELISQPREGTTVRCFLAQR